MRNPSCKSRSLGFSFKADLTRRIEPRLIDSIHRSQTCNHDGQGQSRRRHPSIFARLSANALEASVPGEINREGCKEMPPAVIFTIAGCQFCKKSKAALNDAELAFQEFRVSETDHLHAVLREETQRETFPQIFMNGNFLGGFDELTSYLAGKEKKQGDGAGGDQKLPARLEQAVEHHTKHSEEGDFKFWLKPEKMSIEEYEQCLQEGKLLRSALELRSASSKPFSKVVALQSLKGNSGFRKKEEVFELLQRLLEAHMVHIVGAQCQSTIDKLPLEQECLNFIQADPIQESRKPLNSQSEWYGPARSASKVSQGLRAILLELYDKHLSEEGKSVDYSGLAKDELFKQFEVAATEMQQIDVAPLSRSERIAFFLNVYNILVVHSHARLSPPSNFIQRLFRFGTIKYCIGGQLYSADDIEHGILRGNRPTAASLPVLLGHPEWSNGYFKKDDPRLSQIVNPMDKRIHFALNCGAKSCPPIRVFSPEILEEGLQSAADAFCQGETEIDETKKCVTVSQIFKWYAMDFGSKSEILEFILKHVHGELHSNFKRMLGTSDTKDVTVQYREYDWTQNSS